MSLVLPEADVQFQEYDHSYFRGNERVPSNTQILNDFRILPPYKDGTGAKERGTAVHMACDLIDKGEFADSDGADRYPGTSRELWPYIDAYLRFLDDYGDKFQVLYMERLLYCPIIKTAGRVDRIVLYNYSDLSIIDFKTGDPPPATKLQLSGYEHKIRSMSGLRGPIRRFSLQLKISGKYKFDECPMAEAAFDMAAFVGLAQTWHWCKHNRIPLPRI